MNSNLLSKAKNTIEHYDLLNSGDTVIVGFSGGADSTALLCLLNDLKTEYNLNLIAAHLNHGIRGAEADRDEAFCKEVCEKLGIKIYAFHMNIPEYAKELGVSEEVAGRNARYEFFLGLAGESGKIATAHNAQDAVETLVLNLCRGSGLKGLSSIPPVREMEHPVGCHSEEEGCAGSCESCKSHCEKTTVTKIIRPLLECSREEIEEYLSEKGFSFMTDSTNLSDDYTRNKVRHNIIPAFIDINAGAVSNITRCLSTLREDAAFLDSMADTLVESAKTGDSFETTILLSAELPVLKRALGKIVNDACGSYPEKVHIDKIIDMMKVGRTDQVQVPSGAFARVEGGKLSCIVKI